MPTTSNGFRYPAAADGPDGPGAIFNLASDINSYLTDGTFTPAYGGDGGATLGGSGSGASGGWLIVGKMIVYVGSVTFGSGGSFGTNGTIASLSVGGGLSALAYGTGTYKPASGTSRGLRLGYLTSSEVRLSVETGTGYSNMGSIGSPASGDQIIFELVARRP